MGMLDGKVAVVTGGTYGIGRAVSVRAAAEGAKVVIGARGQQAGIDTVKEIEAAGGEATFIATDVAKADDVEALISGTIAAYGRLDLACNNAGIGGERQLIHEVSEEDFESIMALNLRGCFVCVKLELQQMLKVGGGSIVNMASANGLIGTALFTAYTASKHGMVGLTKAAALEYADKGIRVNAVCPGGVETPLFTETYPVGSESRKAAMDFHPIGRIGTSEEIAAAVVFLWSDKASYITGTCLTLDGGLTAN
jgi:NAD(P)-dependent dehydrogenase (short-subunit alcohol dehydrogenase family)